MSRARLLSGTSVRPASRGASRSRRSRSLAVALRGAARGSTAPGGSAGPRAVRLPCRVVSVGNLVVGGSGQDARRRLARGGAPRGAGGRWRSRAAATGGRGARARWRSSRTAASCAAAPRSRATSRCCSPAHAPGVPVLVGRDRGAVGPPRALGLRRRGARARRRLPAPPARARRRPRDARRARASATAACCRAARCASRLGALSRAHALARRGRAAPRARTSARSRAPRPDAARFALARRAEPLRPLAGGAARAGRGARGRSASACCRGIARPAAFRDTLASLGAHVVAERAFPDHHRYRREDLAGLADEAALWVTTEKDAVKLLPSWLGGARVRVLALETVFPDGEKFLDWLERRLHARAGGRDAHVPGARGSDPG